MRLMLTHLARLLLRIFFRRVEVTGLDHVPSSGPVLFVMNHPNALVDPLLLVALAPRPVAFLAKEPLFRMPVIGSMVRAMDSIPVHRRTDVGADVTRNTAMFAQVWSVLNRGGAVAIFPEGTSHSDARLRPFKTGAARLALGAAAHGSAVQVVPAGLFYTQKATFRSAALLSLGTPILVSTECLGSNGEADTNEVQQLTADLEHAMAAVTLQADEHDALAIVTRAELILTSGESPAGGRLSLVDQLALRRRLVAGYGVLRRTQPGRLERVERSVARLEASLARAGLDAETFNYGQPPSGHMLRYAVRMALYTLVMFPVALVGVVIHFPAYRLIGPLATDVFRASSDLVATVKILTALLLYPVTWALLSGIVAAQAGLGWAGVVLIVAPFSGYIGLRFLETVDQFAGEARWLWLMVTKPAAFRNLTVERENIRQEIFALDAELTGP